MHAYNNNTHSLTRSHTHFNVEGARPKKGDIFGEFYPNLNESFLVIIKSLFLR